MIDYLTMILTATGLFFFFATTIGLLRFPDFYSRMHAAGKGDTLSSLLILSGLALYHLHDPSTANLLVAVKILFILVFIFMASPTATHAIIDAGYQSEVKPWTRADDGEEDDDLAV
ncbi:MAG: monovalent cation/H(+) antiporter subunit G [Desulfurivibrionaceae bacterium]|nr:monovalent cation/H(+) antiporter subunit G [Desulfobulbales bacterium]MDT8334948.1 monovalent cation/H(+) antiporter subunit G [Desulfurivibrionaceae bacterium]